MLSRTTMPTLVPIVLLLILYFASIFVMKVQASATNVDYRACNNLTRGEGAHDVQDH